MQRHEFVRGLGMAALGAVALPEFVAPASSQARGRERIAIVGAGIAGLTAAMRLHDAGIDSTIFESSARIGGRMHSERSYWNAGQHTEWCGAMVDSTHVTIHSLARRFGLGLLDTYAGRPPRARDTCYLDATYYSMADADRDFAKIWPTLQAQLARVDPTTTYANATPTARWLDRMSMRDWIERFVPGGFGSQLGRLIDESYRNEYGRETGELSALNLVMQLGQQRWYERNHQMNVLGYSDQRYILANGSQALPEAIATSLPAGSIRFERRLLGIRRVAGGTYELRFDRRGSREVISVDRVILTMPFIVLRAVDYSGANFDSAKIDAIENLGYGYHTKLHLQFESRAWLRPQHPWPEPTTGQIWTTLPAQSALDYSLGQSGMPGLIEVFTAADSAMLDTPAMPYAQIADASAVERHVRGFFDQLDRIWPGVSPLWNGKATFGNAQADPNIRASYSCWLVGQCTTIAGHEARAQGSVHFAGEHTSVGYQGFMEGGAESGLRAADEVLADYGIRAKGAA
jgi:monoamine oxidase